MNTASASATGRARSVVKSSRDALHVGRDQRLEAGFEDRDLAAAQRGDLVRILVDTGDLMSEIGKAGSGHQAYIARANHGNAHRTNLSAGESRGL